MSFPTNPDNGSTVLINNVVYTYNSAQKTWTKTGSTVVWGNQDYGSVTGSVTGSVDYGTVT